MADKKLHYGNILKTLLKREGISQTDLALSLGVAQSTVSEYFNAVEPSIGTLLRICRACDIKLWHYLAELDTGISSEYFNIIELILKLDGESREFILKQMSDSLDFISRKNKKK